MSKSYDAIVVGARCAGSPAAMLLARKGYRVLVVDRASFPSDTLSTHFIHAPGVAALHQWGLLDQVIASNCPPVNSYSFDFGPITISGTPRPSDGIATGYAPRRTILDKILVDGAARAGAEVREHFTVEEVVIEDGTVVGIRGHGENGKSVVERARVVIGADGRNSHVAKAVMPEQYNEKPMLMWAFYTYWSGLPIDSFATTIRPDRGWAAFPTNDGLTLVVVGWPAAEATAYKSDVEANYLKTLELAPEFAERVRGAQREERFAGGSVPNFFRKPYGPGWALVGDAGYNKDPITAQGISDAFHDAELCADALDTTFAGKRSYTEAMADYHRTRDARVLAIYEFTTQLATMEPPPPEMQQLLGAIYGNQDAMNMFVSMTAGTVSPVEFFAPENIGRLMSAAHSG
ncbi:MAG TPA: NAD(P)/FAD-dependent oxidoreductase [Acidimicrobiia bacterium]|jgi:flavin-dependent dehydrogenase|nr:NAD(P)/FAD-dependent oxidoreductase [Acidimicrobiia bacterium]